VTDTTDASAGLDRARRVAMQYASRPCGVLIVDDWEPLRRIAGNWLQRSGFEVWAASDGREAVALYRKHRTTIDVVLLDVLMPERDGPETLALLREFDACVRCCFMSGDTGKYSEAHLRELGAVAVFQKPFRMSELTERLVRVTTLPHRSDEVTRHDFRVTTEIVGARH
jgi:two-component system, OmpR family, response regulator